MLDKIIIKLSRKLKIPKKKKKMELSWRCVLHALNRHQVSFNEGVVLLNTTKDLLDTLSYLKHTTFTPLNYHILHVFIIYVLIIYIWSR